MPMAPSSPGPVAAAEASGGGKSKKSSGTNDASDRDSNVILNESQLTKLSGWLKNQQQVPEDCTVYYQSLLLKPKLNQNSQSSSNSASNDAQNQSHMNTRRSRKKSRRSPTPEEQQKEGVGANESATNNKQNEQQDRDRQDPQVKFKDQIESNPKLKFRFILEKTRPGDHNFAPLEYDKLVQAFTLKTDPGAVPIEDLLGEEEDNGGTSSSKRRKSSSSHDGDSHKNKKRRLENLDAIESDLEADDLSDVDEDKGKQNAESMALQRELTKAVDSMIKCKWTKGLKPHAEGFKLMGFPHGNPFAVVLERNGWIPDDYFDIIQQPIDLATIKDRVRDLFYDDYESFERQVRLVISNALTYNTDKKSVIHKMAKLQRKSVEDELSKLRKRLGLK